MQIPLTKENLVYIVQTYRNDPKGFLRDVMMIKQLDKWQEELCDLLVAGCTRIAIASCNGSGKTFITSAIELWWLITHADATVSVCSATFAQLMEVHMREIRNHIRNSLITDWYDTSDSTKIKLPNSGDTAFICAVTNNQQRPEAIAGRHHGSLLTVFDEASGIHNAIYMAQEGNMTTAGAVWIVIGNPISSGTAFHDIFKLTNDLWKTIHIDARDCKFTSKKWIEEMIETYGIEDDRVRARVLGQFPRGSINTVVGEGWYNDAEKRHYEYMAQIDKPKLTDPVVIGLDVSRSIGRDSTVICARSGNLLIEIKELVHTDFVDLANQARAFYDKHDAMCICIDYTGGYGAGPGDYLKRELPPGTVREVVFSARATDAGRWINVRSELWMKYGEWIKNGGMVPKHQRLRSDSLDIEWWQTPKDITQVESKDDIKGRGKPSSDYADSVICSLFANPKPHNYQSPNSAQAIINRVRTARKGSSWA